MKNRSEIEDLAAGLLLRQRVIGCYALSFLDCRKLLLGKLALIGSIGEYESVTGEKMPLRVEGCTVSLGKSRMILYDERIQNPCRLNFTVAHELGHIVLSHRRDTPSEEREANRFAAAFLMPEAVIRYLDSVEGRTVPAEKLKNYFAASPRALRRRREELDRIPEHPFSDNETLLIGRLFYPEKNPIP